MSQGTQTGPDNGPGNTGGGTGNASGQQGGSADAGGTQGGQQGASGGQQDQRPSGVSEQEWAALGDPGKQALIRERERGDAAERALAAARARPGPRPGSQGSGQQGAGNGGQQGAGNGGQQGAGNGGQGQNGDQGGQGGQQGGQGGQDLATIVQQAVAAAVRPFQEAEEQRSADAAAQRIANTVLDAARDRLHDATDALAGIDLASVTDGSGNADASKIAAALEDLVKRKPHLAKPDDNRRFAPPGAGSSTNGATRPIDDRVKDTLSRMQTSVGIKPTSS